MKIWIEHDIATLDWFSRIFFASFLCRENAFEMELIVFSS